MEGGKEGGREGGREQSFMYMILYGQGNAAENWNI